MTSDPVCQSSCAVEEEGRDTPERSFHTRSWNRLHAIQAWARWWSCSPSWASRARLGWWGDYHSRPTAQGREGREAVCELTLQEMLNRKEDILGPETWNSPEDYTFHIHFLKLLQFWKHFASKLYPTGARRRGLGWRIQIETWTGLHVKIWLLRVKCQCKDPDEPDQIHFNHKGQKNKSWVNFQHPSQCLN